MKKSFFTLIAAFLASWSWAQSPVELVRLDDSAGSAEVQTTYGKVSGYTSNGIFTFKGISYANAERFMPPENPKSWEGVKSTKTYGAVAPISTVNVGNDEMEFAFNHDWGWSNEDCLNLNVWTPAINDNKKRPVMVWLHGGGFSAGSSHELPSYDGKSISHVGDVVLVSINHRLNVLGFLDLSAYGDKYKASANVGMMDIVKSLEWVRDNIDKFGGDPDNVTIFGQSGGGGKVSTLMYAPSATGLYHKAIVQSGFRGTFQESKHARRIAAQMLKDLKLKSNQVDRLQELPYLELLDVATKALKKVNEDLRAEGDFPEGLMGLNWGPVMDGGFLPFQPTDEGASAISKDIPMMIGSVKNEFMVSLGNPSVHTEEGAKAYLKDIHGDQTEEFILAVKNTYPQHNKPSDLVDVDTRFRVATMNFANLKSSVEGGAPVYTYMFTWQSPVLGGKLKAMHCMELAFNFNNIHLCREMTGGGADAFALADKMSRAWISFARTGDPNHSGLPEWEKYTESNGACMIFDDHSELKHHHDRDLINIVSQR